MRRRGEFDFGIRAAIDDAIAPTRALVASTIGGARRGYYGARDVLAARAEFTRQGEQIRAAESGSPHAIVGAAWWHSISDRRAVIASLSSDYRTFANEVAAAAAARAEPERSADLAWIAASVAPTLEGWAAFSSAEAASWWTMAATDWEAFKSWRDRLVRLRELAAARGLHLATPDPAELPRTIWEAGATGTGGTAAAWLGVLKIAVVGAIGVTGAVAMYSAVRDLRRRPA